MECGHGASLQLMMASLPSYHCKLQYMCIKGGDAMGSASMHVGLHIMFCRTEKQSTRNAMNGDNRVQAGF